MPEELARKIAGELAVMNGSLNRLSELMQSIPDETERRAYRLSLAELMSRSDSNLARPIARAYPHLDPIKF